MTETQDFETPTVSERQAVERERAATAWCARYIYERSYFDPRALPKTFHEVSADVEHQASRRYPLPKRQRPLRVRLSDGRTVWYGMRGWWIVLPNGQERQGIASPPMPGCGDDLRLLARCLDGELEDVPDDE